MLTPYNDLDDAASSTTSISSEDSGSETDHSSETDGTSVSDRIRQDGRLQAVDQWRSHALSWINGPGRAPVVEGPGAAPSALNNTSMEITEQRVTHMLMVDSLDRDQRIYPLPTQFKLRLPRTYRNVERIDIVQVKMLSGFYTFSERFNNTTLTVYDMSGVPLSAEVPALLDGNYTIQQLIDSIRLPSGFTLTYSCVTGRITITGPQAFQLNVGALPTATSNWGLGWNLGFGGPAELLVASYVDGSMPDAWILTASCFPRLTTDYIYLRLNEPEFMNSVDHTDVEDTAVSQDPTGQVSHYFGKLLLNNFGCYAQTFIESPKLFAPVLGRLDRLSFTWVDRQGNPLAGPDATSCDWHMALRIIEIQDRAAPGSTLVRASGLAP